MKVESKVFHIRKITGQGLLLVLPLLAIAAVVVFASHTIKSVNGLTFREDYSKPQSYLTSTQFDACLAASTQQKGNSPGTISADEVKDCEKKASAAPSIDDLMKSRIDELKWMLTMIGSIGAFFVIAQSGAAFFSALIYTRQAEKTLDEISEIEEEVRARYPVFSSVEEQRAIALTDLSNDLKMSSLAVSRAVNPSEVLDYDYKDTLYGSMDIKKRQRILSVESFASIDLDPGPSGAESYPDNLRFLAFFYQSKFQYERTAGFGSLGDLERTEGYLRLAIEKARTDFTLQNDLGVACLDMLRATKNGSDPSSLADHYRRSAFEAFNASLAIESLQMRAHYNLAILHAVHTKPEANEKPAETKKRAYLAAHKELDLALAPRIRNWQRAPILDSARSLALYTRGCYKAWLLGNDDSKTALTLADGQDFLNDLQAAATLGGIPAKVVNQDFEPTGVQESDLADALKKSEPSLRDPLDVAKQTLHATSTKPSPTVGRAKFKYAIRESLKTYKLHRRKN